MVYKNTLEAVLENVKEIEKLVSCFSNYKKIPAIEMDLALEKVRNLYDILLLLNKSCQEQESMQASEETDISVELQPGGESIDVEIADKAAEEAESGSTEKEEPEEPVRQEDKAKEKIVSGRFKSESVSIHDSISKLQQYDDLSSQLQTKPISNIADAIGVNDKFTFVKELFDGDTEKYNNTIDILNKVVNFNDAYNYLMGNFSWDMDSPLVQKILNLIRRKLIINKDE